MGRWERKQEGRSDLVGNRIAEYDYDAGSGTSTLIREYIWMDGIAVGVIEGGEVFFIRTDHIHCPAGRCTAMLERARPVFAINNLGVTV